MAHLNDLFTEATSGALLTSHTADSGGTWSLGYSAGSGTPPKIYNNPGLSLNGVVVAQEAGLSTWKYSEPSPTVGMIVRGKLYFASPGNVYSVGVAARMSSDGTTGYLLAYVTVNATFRLYRFSGAGNPVEIPGSMSSPLSVPLDVGMQPEWVWTITNASGAVHHNFKMGGTTIIDFDDTSSSRVTAAGYTELWFNMLAADAGAYFDSISTTPASATAVTLTGPTAGVAGVASSNFGVGLDGPPSGTVVVTPNDASGGGTFTPTSLSLTSGSPSGTFTYMPASAGAKTISITNNASLADAPSRTYTASSSNAPPTFPGPNIGTLSAVQGVASTLDVHASFSDADALTYSASPAGAAWPSGMMINASTGIITINAAAAGTTTGCKVRATDTASQSVDSNAFNVAVSTPPGTIALQEFRDRLTSQLRANEVIAKIAFLRASDAGPVLTLSNQTTNDSGLLPAISNAALVPGTDYMVASWSASGALTGLKKYQAA